MVQEFKNVFIESIDKHCSSALYTRKYRILDNMLEDIKIFETLSAFDSSSREQFYVHMHQAYKLNSQRRRSRMMRKVALLERNYEIGLSYGKNGDDGTLGQGDV